MKRRCIPPEDFGNVAQLLEGSPARNHLDVCTRCQARFLSYQSFIRIDPDPGGAPVEKAREVLDTLIQRETQRIAPPSPRFSFSGLFHGWRLRAVVLVPATCAAILLAYMGIGTRRGPEEPVLRGRNTGTLFQVEQATVGPDGSLRFAWRSVPKATGYRVRLYTRDLQPLYQSPIQPGTTLAIGREDLASRNIHNADLFWRVAAFSGEGGMSLSSVGTLHIP